MRFPADILAKVPKVFQNHTVERRYCCRVLEVFLGEFPTTNRKNIRFATPFFLQVWGETIC